MCAKVTGSKQLPFPVCWIGPEFARGNSRRVRPAPIPLGPGSLSNLLAFVSSAAEEAVKIYVRRSRFSHLLSLLP